MTAGLFRRHVTRRSQHVHRVSDSAFCFQQPGQSEIGEMRFAFGIEENVARLNVAVQDAVFMRVVNRARQFRDEFRCVSVEIGVRFATSSSCPPSMNFMLK